MGYIAYSEKEVGITEISNGLDKELVSLQKN